MKLIKSIFGLLVLLVLLSALVSSVSAETYDQMVKRMFSEKQAAHPEIWNACNGQCVADIRSGNDWWLLPLLKKVNDKFPSYASPVGIDDLTRYAVVRSNEIAIQAGEDCKNGLIRDLAPKWPTDAQFQKCVIGADWWISAYANNVEATRADFDVSPMVFAVNKWPPQWRVNKDYGGPY